jgi:hypothetical protein
MRIEGKVFMAPLLLVLASASLSIQAPIELGLSRSEVKQAGYQLTATRDGSCRVNYHHTPFSDVRWAELSFYHSKVTEIRMFGDRRLMCQRIEAAMVRRYGKPGFSGATGDNYHDVWAASSRIGQTSFISIFPSGSSQTCWVKQTALGITRIDREPVVTRKEDRC